MLQTAVNNLDINIFFFIVNFSKSTKTFYTRETNVMNMVNCKWANYTKNVRDTNG